MAYCTNCGKQNTDAAKFCTGCGSTLGNKNGKAGSKKVSGIIILLLLLLLAASGIYFIFFNNKKQPATTAEEKSRPEVVTPAKQEAGSVLNNDSRDVNYSLAGVTYTGKSDYKDLVLKIEEVSGNRVRGYNITGGLKRQVEGEFQKYSGTWDEFGDGKTVVKTDIYNLILREPGDHKWDGIFRLKIEVCDRFNKGEGSWEGYKLNLKRQITISATGLSK